MNGNEREYALKLRFSRLRRIVAQPLLSSIYRANIRIGRLNNLFHLYALAGHESPPVPLNYKYPRTGWKCGKEGPLVRRRSG